MLYFSILNQVVAQLTKKYLKFDSSLKIDTTCSENWTKTTKKKLNFKLSLIFLKRSIIISKAKAFTLKV